MKNRIACALLGVGLLAGSATACSKASNADIRSKTRDQLVKGGMTAKQADCLVSKLDDSILNEIRAGKTPTAGSASFQRYTQSIQGCLTAK